MAAAVAITRDLIFSTKIVSTGKALGIDVRPAALPNAAHAAIGKLHPKLVFVDMSLPDNEAIDAISLAAGLESRPTIIAYYSHVDAQLAQSATAAGANVTLPRSRFSEELPSLLQKYCGSATNEQPLLGN